MAKQIKCLGLQMALVSGLMAACQASGKAGTFEDASQVVGTRAKKALPSGRDAYALTSYNECGRRWMERVSLANYAKYGEHSPLWDDKAKTFLAKYAAFRFGSDRPAKLAAAKQVGDELMATGCSDPHLVYVYGNILYQLGDKRQAEPFVRRGFTLLEASAYPRYYLYYGAKRLATIDQVIGGRRQEIEMLNRKKMQYLGQAAGDADFANGFQRYYAELAVGEWGEKSGLQDFSEVAIQEIERLPDVDPWVRLVVDGVYRIHKAWQARGSGWANEVSDNGWNSFGDELAKAGKSLEAAYALHPEFPEAAALMIKVCMGACGESDGRVWFDRAVAAQFDYWSAYSSMLWALRPRWGGSHEAMYQFGMECLLSKRFDTKVPGFFAEALLDIGSELDDWRDVYKRPGVYENAKAYYEGAIAEPSNANDRKTLMTSYAVTAWGAGHYAEAKKLFDVLGDDAPASVFADFHIVPALVMGETQLRCGPARGKLEQAEALAAGGQALKAISLFEALRGSAGSDRNALSFVDNRIEALRQKSAGQKAEPPAGVQ